MDLKVSIERLADAAQQGTGASPGAATVLLFGWNSVHPMRELMSLDGRNRAAALVVIQAAFSGRLQGGKVIEDVTGYDVIQSLKGDYGKYGSAWSS